MLNSKVLNLVLLSLLFGTCSFSWFQLLESLWWFLVIEQGLNRSLIGAHKWYLYAAGRHCLAYKYRQPEGNAQCILIHSWRAMPSVYLQTAGGHCLPYIYRPLKGIDQCILKHSWRALPSIYLQQPGGIAQCIFIAARGHCPAYIYSSQWALPSIYLQQPGGIAQHISIAARGHCLVYIYRQLEGNDTTATDRRLLSGSGTESRNTGSAQEWQM